MKVVINACFGGFGLSHEGMKHYASLKNFKLIPMIEERDATTGQRILKTATDEDINNAFMVHYYKDVFDPDNTNMNYFSDHNIARDDLDLIKTVEALGIKANTRFSKLKIVEIPDDVKWVISEYDGFESVKEEHRSWS